MKTPIPPIHETPEELKELLAAEREAQQYQRGQVLSLLQTQQARTRRQVAHLLGVPRETLGRWLAAYATGGLPHMFTMTKAPGKVPLLSLAMPQALRDRLRPPHGFASSKAMGHWRRQEYGLAMADNTVHQFVR